MIKVHWGKSRFLTLNKTIISTIPRKSEAADGKR
jgi:hypothetical protein